MKTTCLILFIYLITIICESIETYGDLEKRTSCLLIFVVSSSGTNYTKERGTCICEEYKDARIDETGVGTLHLKAIQQLYTDCTQIVPVRIELTVANVWKRVNTWTQHECKRRRRKSTCAIVTSLRPDINVIELPMYSNAYAIRPTTMKATLVDGLMKREVGIG
jgi:hypothetical protein